MRKTFWIILVILGGVLGMFSFFALLELSSNKDELQIIADFDNHASRVMFYAPVFGAILLLLANFVYARHPKIYYFLFVWLFVTVFVLVFRVLLNEKLISFAKERLIDTESISYSAVGGLLISLFTLVVVILNWMLLKYFKR